MLNKLRTKIHPSTDSFYLDFIQKNASIGTWEYDINQQVLEWSHETKKIHEVHKDFKPDVETAIEFYKEGIHRDTISNLFTRCLNELKKYDVELQIITAKGNHKWVRAIGTPIIENGKCIKVLGLFQDIDDKTTLSRSLTSKEIELSKTFDQALIGMATVSLDGKWLKVNKSLCDTFGYTEEQFKKLSFEDLTHPEDKMIGIKAVKQMIDGKINHFKTEKRYISKSGKIIWGLLSTSVVKNSYNKPEFFIVQINDLTQKKTASNNIEQLLQTTENQNERLLNFAHIVSHNLRSHSGNLKMLLDIIKTDIPENTDNEIFPLLEKAVDHLQETVQNLNEVATINLKSSLDLTSQNLLNSCEKAFRTINALILETKPKINLDINPNYSVLTIPAYLDSILLNFITNAIKYRRPNVELTINISAQIIKDNIVIKIEDNGLGIDLKRNRKKLFGMYKTFHKHAESRGIGLFITKNQIESMGGKIEVKSEINKGTTFFIYLKNNENN